VLLLACDPSRPGAVAYCFRRVACIMQAISLPMSPGHTETANTICGLFSPAASASKERFGGAYLHEAAEHGTVPAPTQQHQWVATQRLVETRSFRRACRRAEWRKGTRAVITYLLIFRHKQKRQELLRPPFSLPYKPVRGKSVCTLGRDLCCHSKPRAHRLRINHQELF